MAARAIMSFLGHRLSQRDMSAPEWQLILVLIAVMVTAPVVIQH